MFIHKWNEPYLPLHPSRRESPHFGWYLFSVPLRLEGWVGPKKADEIQKNLLWKVALDMSHFRAIASC